MGVGSSKKEKKEEPKVEAKDLKILLELSQQKCLQFRNKKVNEIKKKKDEIANCLQQNNMELASAKMDNLLKISSTPKHCNFLVPTIFIPIKLSLFIKLLHLILVRKLIVELISLVFPLSESSNALLITNKTGMLHLFNNSKILFVPSSESPSIKKKRMKCICFSILVPLLFNNCSKYSFDFVISL